MGADQSLGRVLVLGLGKSGKSGARYCAELLGERVESLFVAAGAENDDSRAFVESLSSAGVGYAFGDDALASFVRDAADAHMFDTCIASPGIPFWHELYQDALAISGEVISEIEFAWRESAPDSIWVAITGTNGKTTTTSCCAHILRACGFAADAVGNIGDVCLDAVQAGNTHVYVCEVSSYQLYSTNRFAPDIAVMLNITPDHLHWHKTLQAYRDAKFKVFDNLGAKGSDLFAPSPDNSGNALSTSVAILDATNDVVRAKVRELRKMAPAERGFAYIPMGTADGIAGDMRARCGSENAAFIGADGVLRIAFDGKEHELVSADELQIHGLHNASNALAAAAVAVALKANDADIANALRSFPPLEHRIEPCGTVAGVACFNDSKATNVDATVTALSAFPGKRVIVLLGGDDKGTDLSALVSAARANAAMAVCFGDAADRFAHAFELESEQARNSLSHDGDLELFTAAHMEDALDVALAQAHSGDVVLLSPACASFDEFKSFEERGRAFKRMVAARQ